VVHSARKQASYADVLASPEHVVAEIIGGQLITSPRPAPRHARAASRLGVALGNSFDQDGGDPGGWWILDEPELHLERAGHPIVPDLAGWRVERLPELPDAAHFELAPDWICEVLSASTEAVDRADKMPVYAAAGVSHAWLIDPLLTTLEVFRREQERWVLVTTHKGDIVVRAEPFDAVAIDLRPLWRRSARG
jgi:Uma2 family endonuclease